MSGGCRFCDGTVAENVGLCSDCMSLLVEQNSNSLQHTQAKMPSYGESINAIVAETGIKELNYRERKLTLAIHDYIARHIGCA